VLSAVLICSTARLLLFKINMNFPAYETNTEN
jgi:hypothetical protein